MGGSLSTQEIMLKHVCPGAGVGIALILFASPLPSVLRCNKAKCLGELNPLPFVAMAINCAAWIFYAKLLGDYYIYFGNLPGVTLGSFYVLTCYKFSKEAAQDMLRNIMLGGMVLYWAIGLISLAAALDAAGNKTLWGATAVSVLGIYYAAPLSSVAKVVAERDSSSLHWPLCTMNIINGMLWFAYGLALKDWFVALPNGIGAGFNVLCLALCWVFPAKRRKQHEQQEQQEQQQPGAVLDRINPAANWGALRLQSIARRPDGLTPASAGASGGGFFDLTRMRWRTGGVGSFRGGSFLRLLSGSQRGSSQRGSSQRGGQAAAAGGAGAALGVPDAAWKAAGVASLDQQDELPAASDAQGDAAIKAVVVGGDLEQAHVVADATNTDGSNRQQGAE